MQILNCYSNYDFFTKNRYRLSPAKQGVSAETISKTQDCERFVYHSKKMCINIYLTVTFNDF